MQISTSTWMMVAFVVGTALSIWKMYPFLVNKTLEDDDTGEDAHANLVAIMHKVLQNEEQTPTEKELYEKMSNHKEFDKEKFWRFNLNKLNQLLNRYYAENPNIESIKDIHQKLKKN